MSKYSGQLTANRTMGEKTGLIPTCRRSYRNEQNVSQF
jgi:hypothetical protein